VPLADAVPPWTWLAGLPYDLNGRLVIDAADPVVFVNGWPVTAAGAVAVSTVPP
jgi:hypothetical protein